MSSTAVLNKDSSPLISMSTSSIAYTERRVFHLFGYPIAHSLSPVMHNAIFSQMKLPWEYVLHESTDLTAFLDLVHRAECYGSSVTMPFKIAIMPHLDELTEEAREVGACNTIFVREEADRKVYCGTNTDVVGIREALLQNTENPEHTIFDRPAMVIGGGGAARSAVYALHKWLRATRIYIVNRDPVEVDAVITECTARGFGSKLVHVASSTQAHELESPGAVVSCVPDFPPRTNGEIEARQIAEIFMDKGSHGSWLEMAYHPNIWPELAKMARARQWNVIVGTEAMLWQGFEQSKLWTGKAVSELPLEEVRSMVNEAVVKKNSEGAH